MTDKFPHRSADFESFMAGLDAERGGPKDPTAGRFSCAGKYTMPKAVEPSQIDVKGMRVKDLVTFIKAREAARIHKTRDYATMRGADIAYGKLDPIIRKYRFCNM